MNASSLQSRLNGSPTTRFLRELFGNSLHFPIANIVLEMLAGGPGAYFASPDPYILLLAGVLQAYFLNRWEGRKRLPGNLIGPALYTLVEAAIEGASFFHAPNHTLYWAIALIFGLTQAIRPSASRLLAALTILIEEVSRASILLLMYYIFEMKTSPVQTASLSVFFSDPSHQFVTVVALLLGLTAGLANLTAQHYLALLRETLTQLRTYSEWFLGHDLLEKAISNPDALQLQRQEHTVLFMDIRGFTGWSETRTPEEVVSMLNRYYQIAEATLNQHHVIKVKFTADEVLAIFPTVDYGLQAALDLNTQINQYLGRHGLSVGTGMHSGPMVEGLLGSKNVKLFDVVGDTVNTAKRIESAAGPGEVLVSEPVRLALGATFRAGAKRQVAVKGKDEPVTVYPLG